jgi:hypothetical protein
MKKIILTALTCLLMEGAQAQIVSSRSISITQEKKAPSETLTYGRVGLGLMNFTGDDVNVDTKLGYDIAVGFQKAIGSNDLYWGMEAGLGSRGFKDKYYDGSLIAHNIQVSPFNFGWKPEIGNDLKLDIHVGVFASYDFVGTVKDENETYGLGDVDGWNRFDIGLNPGVGIWFGKYNIDLSLQRGLLEAIEDSKAYTQNVLIRFGIAF